jgi:L-methionine (R)-S-oxide reductase
MESVNKDSLLEKFKKNIPKGRKEIIDYTVKFLNENVNTYNWVGIYMVHGEDLILEGWQGPEATEHTRIKIGDGICGLAAKEQFTVIVPDVAKDSRYIACFPETKSEIVVPIFKNGKVIGEIDIDSDFTDPFNDSDKKFLEQIANFIGRRL